METFDPNRYYRPVAHLPYGFERLESINDTLKRNPADVLDVIRLSQGVIQTHCEMIVSPQWQSSSVQSSGKHWGLQGVLENPLVRLQPLPFDIVLPIEFDYDDRLQSNSVDLTLAVGLEVLRTLRGEPLSEMHDKIRMARAKTLYRTFGALLDMEERLDDEQGDTLIYRVAPSWLGWYQRLDIVGQDVRDKK